MLRVSARSICDAGWWERAAQTSGRECRAPLSALILQIGIDSNAADRVLAVGSTPAATALLQAAPEAPTTAALERVADASTDEDFAASLRVVLASRGR